MYCCKCVCVEDRFIDKSYRGTSVRRCVDLDMLVRTRRKYIDLTCKRQNEADIRMIISLYRHILGHEEDADVALNSVQASPKGERWTVTVPK